MSVGNTLLNGPLGYGGAPLGNMFRNIPEEEALGTVNAAWDQGIRYFDTAPFYGAGLSEIRMGKVLSRHKRDEYVLSTKVGRIILNEVETGNRHFGEKGNLFEHGRANKIVYDYTEKGAIKSIEDSLQRLGIERLDFVWVHDIAQDFHGDAWISMFETARTGAFRALSKLYEKGTIKAWGLGVNRVEPCLSQTIWLRSVCMIRREEVGVGSTGREPSSRRASATAKPRSWFKVSLKMA